MSERRYLGIGSLVRPHGVHGELRLRCDEAHVAVLRTIVDDDSGAATAGATRLALADGTRRTVTITSVRGADSAPILALDGIAGRDAAVSVQGSTLEVDRALLPDPDEDEFFLGDLRGCVVVDAAMEGSLAEREAVGEVVEARALPANVVLDVLMAASHGGSSVLVPFTRAVVPDVDVAGGRLSVDLAFLGVERVADA